MPDIPDALVIRRDKYCKTRSIKVAAGPPGIGLEAVVWPTQTDSVLKVHRLSSTFYTETAVYQKLMQTRTRRLKGFSIPQLLNYDADLLVVELSFVTPPYILDFGMAECSGKPADYDLDVIEAEFSRQFDIHWPEVRRLLESLMQLGVYYRDAHNRNIRLR